MKIQDLLAYLELEEAEEFAYFENLADLVEADFQIPSETLFQLLSQVDMATFSDLLRHYFEDVLESVPQDAVELYTLLDTAQRVFLGIARHLEEDRDLVVLSEEFSRFRNWYSVDSAVSVAPEGADSSRAQVLPVRDALTLARLEHLGGEKLDYDFSSALDFELDQYSMSFMDLLAEEEELLEAEAANREEFN